MGRWKRLAYYLLLNVLVSACTVWTALYIWEWRHPGSSGEVPLISLNDEPTPTSSGVLSTIQAHNAATQASNPGTIATLLPTAGAGVVSINNAFGTGVLDTEKIRITNNGDGPVSLAGWTLEDEDGNRFLFPQIQLFSKAEIDVFTTAGNDSSTILYWGLLEPVWSPGETASLYDSQGNLQGTYELP